MGHLPISAEALMDLRRRLATLPPRSAKRRQIMQETAALYGVSEPTLYRILRQSIQPRALRRSDYGVPRVLPKPELERYCEVIAAIKVRTANRKDRHLSTSGAIRLLEQHGLQTPDGFIQAPLGILKLATVNHYLKQWGYDRHTLQREPPAVRFQAQHSNDCWQFDLSPSDIKHIEKPIWVDESKGAPTLMLYSIVDDRSGVAYQEYHCVYGEDVVAGLTFLFNAMAPKSDERFLLQGIPAMIYMDSGPIAHSHVFQQVMRYLGVDVRTHLPRGKDGRRTTARAKGKVERPFRSVKEMHETLYHFHAPETEQEANAWLFNFLLRYNAMPHRSESHSRFDDWLQNAPAKGIRSMCDWERYCTFAREPEQRKVGVDARISIEGVSYDVDAELAGETVVLWWGLFDTELYIEQGEQRYGPYTPVGGPIPLHRYRRFKKSRAERRADRIATLAEQLLLPRSALEALPDFPGSVQPAVTTQPFKDPDPFHELVFSDAIAAKYAIADLLGLPLAKLDPTQLDDLNALLARTLSKKEVLDYVRTHIQATLSR